mmetsp:Transcript_35161/g.87935  ORF Transcript_35161/g.87935 Transcript_35161/m.87935 type:complete len:481 (-) Transcript_35161:143-1585(-)
MVSVCQACASPSSGRIPRGSTSPAPSWDAPTSTGSSSPAPPPRSLPCASPCTTGGRSLTSTSVYIPRAWRVGLSDPDKPFITPGAEGLFVPTAAEGPCFPMPAVTDAAAAATTGPFPTLAEDCAGRLYVPGTCVPTVTADVEAAVLTDSLPVDTGATLAGLITSVLSLADQLRVRGGLTVDARATLAALVAIILSLADQLHVGGDLTEDALIQDLVSLNGNLRDHRGLGVSAATDIDTPTACIPAAAERLYVHNITEGLYVPDTAGGPVVLTVPEDLNISYAAPCSAVSPPSLGTSTDASAPVWTPSAPCPGAPQRTASPPSFITTDDASAPAGAPYAPDPGTFLSTASPPSSSTATDASAPAGDAPGAGTTTSLPSFVLTMSSLSRGTASATSRTPRVRSTRSGAARRGRPATKRYRRRCAGRAAACDTADLLYLLPRRLTCTTSRASASSLTSRAATTAPLRILLRPGTSWGAAPTLS